MRLLQVSQTGVITPIWRWTLQRLCACCSQLLRRRPTILWLNVLYIYFYHLRKHLVECLVLSRLDFNDIIFYPITDCLLKRLQRIQFAAASFVFRRYVNNIDSIPKLGWLPMKERREWHVLKAAHKAIYSHDWPRNLQLEQVKHARNLQSSSTINLVIPHASDTFQYSTAALFNSLPSNVKWCDNFRTFSKQILCILRERCRNRVE